MRTYQDLLILGEDEKARREFIMTAINEHTASEDYRTAATAELYAKRRNKTIMDYQKILYTMAGDAVPDNFSANHKCVSNFFYRFVTQEVQFLLANGVQFGDEKTAEALGKGFDTQLQRGAKYALIDGVSFGFYNLDHVEFFKLTEFVPLWDELSGKLAAGIRFWQIDSRKPLRCTLYEMDGYTEYVRENATLEFLEDGKKAYTYIVTESEAGGMEIAEGESYNGFPIVPFWGNDNHQSELVGMRNDIDAYDLIKSGFANDLDDCSQIYWIIKNAGGMDDVDLARFLERLKTVRAAVVDADDGESAESHTVDIPYQSRETYLSRLRADLYEDAMALDTANLASGSATATHILAAYEPLNSKCDEFEYQCIDFIENILKLAGIEDTPTFTRSKIVNAGEEIQNILLAAEYLDETYITRKILDLLGDGEQADEILLRREVENVNRMTNAEPDEDEGGEDE